MSFSPCLIRSSTAAGEVRFELGHPLVDRYLEFVAGRSRPNTLRAIAFDLKTFFAVVGKDPITVEPTDVFEFVALDLDPALTEKLLDVAIRQPITQIPAHGEDMISAGNRNPGEC